MLRLPLFALFLQFLKTLFFGISFSQVCKSNFLRDPQSIEIPWKLQEWRFLQRLSNLFFQFLICQNIRFFFLFHHLQWKRRWTFRVILLLRILLGCEIKSMTMHHKFFFEFAAIHVCHSQTLFKFTENLIAKCSRAELERTKKEKRFEFLQESVFPSEPEFQDAQRTHETMKNKIWTLKRFEYPLVIISQRHLMSIQCIYMPFVPRESNGEWVHTFRFSNRKGLLPETSNGKLRKMSPFTIKQWIFPSGSSFFLKYGRRIFFIVFLAQLVLHTSAYSELAKENPFRMSMMLCFDIFHTIIN